jgi:predicted amidohydrolase
MSDFKIAAAQVASLRGDIAANVATHAAAISAAARHGVNVLIFPELSLTGYEPALAAELAIAPTDARLTPLQTLVRQHGMDVVVGAPLLSPEAKPNLGVILFASDGTIHTYAKMHLGGSEPNYFTPGDRPLSFTTHGQQIGVAICADSSHASHPQNYSAAGAAIYATGVFLNAEWYATDTPRLAQYAARHRLLVVMANHADSVGTYNSIGKSAVWSPDGTLLVQAAGTENCLVVVTNREGAWRGEEVESI